MASDSFTALGPSDSGFLNSFLSPPPSAPLQSRVGEKRREETAEPDGAASEPDSESVLEGEPAGDALLQDSSAEPTDEQLDAALRQALLPEGFLVRMRRIADEP